MVDNKCDKYEELTREAESLFNQITTNGLSSSKIATPFLEYYEEKEELKISTGLTYNTL